MNFRGAGTVWQSNFSIVAPAGPPNRVMNLSRTDAKFKEKDEYEISAAGQQVTLSEANEQSLLYALIVFIER
jgi:hypothetical protein